MIWAQPKAKRRWWCPHCECRCPRYDPGRARRWRALDAGRVLVFLACQPPRVTCPEHGVVVAAVPWARHAARHTRGFEQTAAWCATQMSITAATTLLRCAWRTIGVMLSRVAADLRAGSGSDGLDGLAKIGIDEISYRKGHRYLVVVVDHGRRRLVWAGKDRTRATVRAFFDDLGEDRARAVTHVTSDGAGWIADVLAERVPHAVHCLDPFHVVRWAMDALDEVRRETWNAVRSRQRRGRPASGAGKAVKDARWALWKNPEHHTDRQRAQLAYIAATHPVLHRAWALKEGLRTVFTLTGVDALAALDAWLGWASRCRIDAFVTLGRRIRSHYHAIAATLNCGLTNALAESINTKIRLIARRAFGFHNIDALIALAKLTVGDHHPELPT